MPDNSSVLRDMAKKNIDTLKKERILKENYTGKVVFEVDVNAGNVTQVKVRPEIRA